MGNSVSLCFVESVVVSDYVKCPSLSLQSVYLRNFSTTAHHPLRIVKIDKNLLCFLFKTDQEIPKGLPILLLWNSLKFDPAPVQSF